jgi:hypothetical protein
MSSKIRWFVRPWMVLVIFIIVAGVTVFMSGQQRGQMANPQSSMHVPILTHGPQDEVELPGFAEDWSTHHLVFSNPGTEEDAIANGTHERWLETVNNPRYIMQQLRRRSPAQGPAAEYVARMNALAIGQEAPGDELRVGQLQDFLRLVEGSRPGRREAIHNDWQQTLGTYSPSTRVAGQYPAKFSFNSAANCASDYVVYTTGNATSTSTATVIAYYELYGTTGSPGTGCGATTGVTVPTIYWAYNTSDGTAANATLSPVIDFLGAQVAYIQNTSSKASLVILKFAKSGGSVATPASATFEATTSYNGCPAPCYTLIPFSTTTTDTTSAPFYDYSHDTVWVGDSGGNLHEFTNVFRGGGTPAESGSPFKSAVSASALLSPVYDTSTGLVFVGDTSTTTGTPFHSVCGVTGINSVCTTAGTLTTSGAISDTAGVQGMFDAPLVDSTLSKAYVFIADDGSTGCLTGSGGSTACQVVDEYSTKTSIASGSQTPTKAIVGRYNDGTSAAFYSGAFSNGYYTAGTGDIYVCGNESHVSDGTMGLYQIATTTGTMATSSTLGPTITSSGQSYCSPVTEFLNGINDYMFVSVGSGGTPTGCTNGCLSGYTIPATWSTSLAPNGSVAVTGGSSGIIIDNSTATGTLAGASEIYFYPLAAEDCPSAPTSGCAVQATQAIP